MATRTKPTPYWNPYFAGVVLGLVLFASFILAGEGLGASGGVARVMAFVVDHLSPRFVDCNPYLVHLAGGAKNPLNQRMVWMIIGLVCGGFVSGLVSGRLKAETLKGPHVGVGTRWVLAFIGGVLMGFGAALARGCTSGKALSGGAVLAVGSWAFMMMIFAGGYLIAYPFRKLWN